MNGRNHRVLLSLWQWYLWWMTICGAPEATTAFAAKGFALVGVRICKPMPAIGRVPNTGPWARPNRRQEFTSSSSKQTTSCYGWLENFFEPDKAASSDSRQVQYPEQYPATYARNEDTVAQDADSPEALLVRPLLKNTQLQSRPLQVVYEANRDGWNPQAFHTAVDGKGASVVVATDTTGRICGGYNPKGHASLGGARPSVAAFLFYERRDATEAAAADAAIPRFQKLRKVGGGGLACARDDPDFGISFGPDGLVIGLQAGRERLAASKLGPYFERGPQDLPSLFASGAMELTDLKVLVGVYDETEEIPYSGGVLDMTSG